MFFKIKKIFAASVLSTFYLLAATSTLFAASDIYTIVLDPAHGGRDTGVKITEKIYEKDITLAISQALFDELSKEANIKIVLTRDADTEISSEKMKKIVQEAKPHFFLSIHINKGFGKDASGFELYYPGFGKYTAGGIKGIKDLSGQRIKHLNESIRMAHIIQRNLDAIFLRKGRGLREADMFMLDGLTMPALVVEIGFASNSDDRKKILSAKKQAEIAQALSKSIKSFYR